MRAFAKMRFEIAQAQPVSGQRGTARAPISLIIIEIAKPGAEIASA